MCCCQGALIYLCDVTCDLGLKESKSPLVQVQQENLQERHDRKGEKLHWQMWAI